MSFMSVFICLSPPVCLCLHFTFSLIFLSFCLYISPFISAILCRSLASWSTCVCHTLYLSVCLCVSVCFCLSLSFCLFSVTVCLSLSLPVLIFKPVDAYCLCLSLTSCLSRSVYLFAAFCALLSAAA